MLAHSPCEKSGIQFPNYFATVLCCWFLLHSRIRQSRCHNRIQINHGKRGELLKFLLFPILNKFNNILQAPFFRHAATTVSNIVGFFNICISMKTKMAHQLQCLYTIMILMGVHTAILKSHGKEKTHLPLPCTHETSSQCWFNALFGNSHFFLFSF